MKNQYLSLFKNRQLSKLTNKQLAGPLPIFESPVVISDVEIIPNPVKTKEEIKIKVKIKQGISEPVMYRLPFRLGSKKGEIK